MEMAVQQRTDRKRAWEKLVSCYLEKGDFQGADAFFEKTIRVYGIDKSDFEKLRAIHVSKFLQKSCDLPEGFDLEQQEAIASPHKNTLVTARAGSGKTRVIAGRAAFLMKAYGVKKEEILVLSFNSKAAKEVTDRLERKTDGGFGLGRFPFSKTFHSFAYRILDKSERRGETLVDTKKIPGKHGEEIEIDTNAQRKFITESLFDVFDSIAPQLASISGSRTESVTQEGKDKHCALTGDIVKSHGEKLLLDFLLLHGFTDIAYEKEYCMVGARGARTVKNDAECGHPSRPGLKIIFEHWGVTGPEDVVPTSWTISAAEYWKNKTEKTVYWKGKEADGKHCFIESSVSESGLGKDAFWAILKRRLESRLGVEIERLPEKDAREKMESLAGAKWEVVKKVQRYIQRAQQKKESPDQMAEQIRQHVSKTPEEKDFLEVANAVYRRYEEKKKELGKKDFNSVIRRATETVMQKHGSIIVEQKDERPLQEKTWQLDLTKIQHILIDEYQDFSALFYDLIQSVRHWNPGVRLFAVGDDWQAINEFAGSEVRYLSEFKKVFEDEDLAEKTISTNYRSQAKIVGAGNELMSRVFGGKNARAHRPEDAEISVVDFEDKTEGDEQFVSCFKHEGYKPWKEKHLAAILKAMVEIIDRHGTDVLLLSRMNRAHGIPLPEWERKLKSFYGKRLKASKDDSEMKILAKTKTELTVLKEAIHSRKGLEFWLSSHLPKMLTAHKSKGAQEKTVILLDASERCFPSTTKALRDNGGYFRIFGETPEKLLESERRLFYVALTRAKDKLYIFKEKEPTGLLAQAGIR